MLAYFPTIYDDELLYSTLSRLWVHTGHSAYTYFATNLYTEPKHRIDIDFFNQFTNDAFHRLTHTKSIIEIINQNTMAPAYLHFNTESNKKAVMTALCNNTDTFKSHLTLSASGIPRYLKYCPICAAEDREKYGEAIWHRSHQLEHLILCPKHNIYLVNSSITMMGKESPILHPAQLEISASAMVIEENNDIIIQFSQYINSVLNTPINIDTPTAMGTYLHTKLYGTKYVSIRGEQRNMSLLFSDIKEYYSGTYLNDFLTESRLQKLFTSYRNNFFEICLLAFFLQVPENDLCSRALPLHDQVKEFDAKVQKLHQQGIGFNKIGRELGVSSRTIQMILKPKSSSPKTNNFTCGPEKKDWNAIDVQTLPLVNEAITKMLSAERPKRINVFAITKLLSLPDKTLYQLPMCLAKIKEYEETQEEFWARELLWAYTDTIEKGEPLHWTSLRRRTNLRRKNAEKSIPTIIKSNHKYADLVCALIKTNHPGI